MPSGMEEGGTAEWWNSGIVEWIFPYSFCFAFLSVFCGLYYSQIQLLGTRCVQASSNLYKRTSQLRYVQASCAQRTARLTSCTGYWVRME